MGRSHSVQRCALPFMLLAHSPLYQLFNSGSKQPSYQAATLQPPHATVSHTTPSNIHSSVPPSPQLTRLPLSHRGSLSPDLQYVSSTQPPRRKVSSEGLVRGFNSSCVNSTSNPPLLLTSRSHKSLERFYVRTEQICQSITNH
jgi:hypothetical protein